MTNSDISKVNYINKTSLQSQW